MTEEHETAETEEQESGELGAEEQEDAGPTEADILREGEQVEEPEAGGG